MESVRHVNKAAKTVKCKGFHLNVTEEIHPWYNSVGFSKVIPRMTLAHSFLFLVMSISVDFSKVIP